MKKRILALLLVLCMLFSTMPMMAFAESGTPTSGAGDAVASASPEAESSAAPAASAEPSATPASAAPDASAAPAASADPASSEAPAASADPAASTEPAASEAPAASAAPAPEESEEPLYHADIDFKDMKVQPVDLDAMKEDLDKIVALKGDAANVDKIQEMLFGKDGVVNKYMQILDTNRSLLNIKTSVSIADKGSATQYRETVSDFQDALDMVYLAMKEIITSPCEQAIKTYFTSEEDWEFLETYEAITEEEKAETDRIVELQQQYDTLFANGDGYFDVPITVEGVETTFGALYEAYQAGKVQGSVVNQAQTLAFDEWSEEMAKIYIELISLHNAEAKEEGYDTYAEYAYENVFQRDYTPEKIADFEKAVKEYFPPLYAAFDNLLATQDNPYEGKDYSGDIAFDMIEPYVKTFSPEMKESFTYMREHHLYDYADTPNKAGGGFTTILSAYGAPFTFNTPEGSFYDFTTAVHEFGHYNRYYWTPADFFASSDSIDMAEVHSQGFELLFMQFYPEIFGDDSSVIVNYQMDNLIYAILSGCMEDEFQQYAFSEPNLTADKLEAKHRELLIEYGFFEEGDANLALNSYYWFGIPHHFSTPFYYISYATSAAAAFSFWLDAQENGWEAANEAYNKLVLIEPGEVDEDGNDLGFVGSLKAVGVEDPTTGAYAKELAEKLEAATDPEGQYAALMEEYMAEMESIFSDVDRTNPLAQYIWSAYSDGITGGTGDGAFHGEEPFTRAQAAAIIHNGFAAAHDPVDGVFSDVPDTAWYAGAVNWAADRQIVVGTGDGKFNPDAVITEEELVTYLYKLWTRMGNGSADPSVELPYADADDISDWAYEAMVWASMLGIIAPDENGNVEPQMQLTRADAVVTVWFLYNYLHS